MNRLSINIFLLIVILFSAYCAVLSGLSWDEGAHMMMGYERLNYFFTFGIDKIDRSVLTIEYYPGLTFTIAAFIIKIFPREFEIEVLHLVNLFFSFTTIFGIYSIAKIFFNSTVAKITFLVSVFNPIFFGHMFINPKDTVVAASYVWITYLVIKYLKQQNNEEKSKKIIIYISLIGVLGTGVRLVFWGSLIPVIIFILIDIFFLKKIICKNFLKKKFLIDSIKIIIFTYFILVIFWPETHQNIIIYPAQFFFETLSNFENYGTSGQSGAGTPIGLLNGKYYFAYDSPSNYILINLFYKLPEYLIISYIIFIYFVFTEKDTYLEFDNFNYKIILIIFIFIFVNFIHLLNPYPTYDGLRHFLYILPFLSIIPALTIYLMILKIKKTRIKFFSFILSFFIILCLFKFFSLTPYQYTYLNLFTGKAKNHYTKFENDYWNVSLKELIKKSNFLNDDISRLTLCGVEKAHAELYLKKFNYSKVLLVREDENYDYILMNNRVTYGNINNLESAQTCFEKYKGPNLSSVSRNGLIISQIKKKHLN